MKRTALNSMIWIACLILSACNLPGADGPSSPSALSTAAAQTVEVALSAPVPSRTPPIATVPQVTATITAIACDDQMQIISWTRDGDIYDVKETEKRLAPDASFTMSWDVMNKGTCVWDDTYKFVLETGEPLTTQTSLPVMPNGYHIKNGETLTITVAMKAPSKAGRFDSSYSLVNAENKDVLTVGIITNVGTPSSASLAAPGELRYTYDCSSGSVQIALSWIDNSSDEDGFRIYRENVKVGEVGEGVTSFQDVAPSVGKFRYTVAAFNGGGESPASMNVETKNCE